MQNEDKKVMDQYATCEIKVVEPQEQDHKAMEKAEEIRDNESIC